MPFSGKCSALALAVPFAAAGIEIWVKYPCNHGGGLALPVALGVLALVLNLLWMVRVRRVSWFRIGALVSLALLLLACDRFNVSLSYEEWIRRGMPEWGEWGGW